MKKKKDEFDVELDYFQFFIILLIVIQIGSVVITSKSDGLINSLVLVVILYQSVYNKEILNRIDKK